MDEWDFDEAFKREDIRERYSRDFVMEYLKNYGMDQKENLRSNLEALMKDAFSNQEDPILPYIIGWLYDVGMLFIVDKKKAINWYKKAGKRGYAAAQYNLGFMYDQGEGVEKDWRTAVQWYERAAEQGYLKAQYNLACLYAMGNEGGEGVDIKKLVKWCKKAAEGGIPEAQFNLGAMYELGDHGIPRNERRALELYSNSSEGGCEDAHFVLAEKYEKGEGVAMDVAKAIQLFRKAEDAGDQEAVVRIVEILRHSFLQ